MPSGRPQMPSSTALSKSKPSQAGCSSFTKLRTHSSSVFDHKSPRPTLAARSDMISTSDLLSPAGVTAGLWKNTQGARSRKSHFSQ